MSVRAKDRSVSIMEFLNNMHELEILTIKLAMNEKYIPKRYRFVFAMPLMESVRKIGKNVTYGNSIYITKNDPASAIERRKRYFANAIIEIQNSFEIMRLASEMLPVNENVLKEWTGRLLAEEKLLKGVMKSDKDRL